MASLKELKNQFLEYIEIEKGRSLRTIQNYDPRLTRFLNFLKSDNPAAITDASVREFRMWLHRQPASRNKNMTQTLSKKTQNYYMIILRAFLKYLARQDIKTLPAERIELAKVGERHLDLITKEELSRLLASPKTSELKDLRDRAILELLFSTGLRVSELCSLNADIDLSIDEYSIRGKGGKIRVVFLSDEAKKAVREYLKARKDMGEALFVRIDTKNSKKSGKDERLDKRSIERIVKQHGINAGISKKVTPHVMRHMFATDLLSNGADMRSVQSLLGHSSISTTQMYTHVTDKHLHDIHKKFHNRK